MLPVAHTLEEIPAGTRGLDVKLARLRELVEASKRNPSFRRWVLDVVRDVREGDWTGELSAVSRWIRRNVTYRHDPIGVELFTAPDRLAFDAIAGEAAGDCDDLVALGAAMAETLGHPTRFRVGGATINGQETWSHIWRETYNKALGRWVSYDDTAKKRPPGWSPASRYRLGKVTPAGKVGRLGGMAENRVGVPVYDEDGNAVPGLAQFVDGDLADYGDGSLGSLRKRARRASKQVGRIARKVAPVAALAVNVVPGAGQVASAAIAASMAADKAKRARTAARRAVRADEAWAAEQARTEQARPAIVQSPPMAMELPPPRAGVVVGGDESPELPFEESVAPAPIAAALPPEAPPASAFDPSWADDTEQDALGGDWGSNPGMQRKMPGWLRQSAGSRMRRSAAALRRAHEDAGLGFDWASVVNNAMQAGTQYAAAGGFGRRTQRAVVRHQPAIETARAAVAPVVTRGVVAAERWLRTPSQPKPAPKPPQGKPSGIGRAAGGGMGIAVAAAAALLLLGRGRR